MLFERDPTASKRELEDAEAVARHALAEVRCAVTGSRAADLAAELASARLMLESSGVHLDYGRRRPACRRTSNAAWRWCCARRSPTSRATRTRGRRRSSSPGKATGWRWRWSLTASVAPALTAPAWPG